MLGDTTLFHRGIGKAWMLQCSAAQKDICIYMHKIACFLCDLDAHSAWLLFIRIRKLTLCTAGNAGRWYIHHFWKLWPTHLTYLRECWLLGKLGMLMLCFRWPRGIAEESEQPLRCFVFFRDLIVWKKADSIIQLIILLIMRTGKHWRFLM